MRAKENYFDERNQCEGVYVRYYNIDYECQHYEERYNEELEVVGDFIMFLEFDLYGKEEDESIEEFVKNVSYQGIEDLTAEVFYGYDKEIIGSISNIDMTKFKKVTTDFVGDDWEIYSKISN
jgi:hypothetical protein